MSVELSAHDPQSVASVGGSPFAGPGDGFVPMEADILPYRTLSPLAIAAFAAGLSSVMAFLDPILAVVPLLGIGLSVVALVQLRSRSDELIGGKWARWGLAASAFCLVGSIASFAYEYATEVPEGYERTNFTQLEPTVEAADAVAIKGIGDANVAGMAFAIPDSAKALEGKKVFIKGFMHPKSIKKQRGIKEFVLVRDNNQCCFGAALPKTNDMIMVYMTGNVRAQYDRSVVKLAGTFRLEPRQAEGLGAVVYRLDAEIIK